MVLFCEEQRVETAGRQHGLKTEFAAHHHTRLL